MALDIEPVAGNPTLELDSINWNDVNAEVEAAMNESEDDDNVEIRSGLFLCSCSVQVLHHGSSINAYEVSHHQIMAVGQLTNKTFYKVDSEFGDSSFNIAKASTLMDAWVYPALSSMDSSGPAKHR
ncbi:hypothetical protein EDC04DRAFT_2611130 [Pisolithus marmoratus]|nr:hypothetical protein EDC04DRAFT_2611130 [Pisolithus marmoratus]